MIDYFILTNNSNPIPHLKTYNISKDIFLHSSKAPEKFKSKKFVLNIFGSIEGNYENEFLTKKSINNIFKKIDNKEKLFSCVNNCEGRFVIIASFKSETYVLLDRFSKKDVFLLKQKSHFYISDNFKAILNNNNNLSFNSMALSNLFLVYGVKMAKKDTIFNEIKRIGVNEKLLIKKNKFEIVDNYYKPESSIEYNDKMIDKYYEINKSFFLNFGEKKRGLFMSSGFDSSYLLALQQQLFGSKNVIGLTCVQKFNQRSGVYNKFEIERVNKLAKFYNISDQQHLIRIYLN